VADYTPTAQPGADYTYSASAAVVGGQVLTLTGAGTVGPSAGTTTEPIVGIAAHDAAIGARVNVSRGGVQRPIAAGTIAAGAVVRSAAAGQVTTATTATDNPQSFLGVAIEGTTVGLPLRVAWRA
jgi:hypothetical protein